MFVDSHCHLNYPGLKERLPEVLGSMDTHKVKYALSVCVVLENFLDMLGLIDGHSNLFASVGIHPEESHTYSLDTLDRLINLAQHEKVVAIGETGLDYLRVNDNYKIQMQQECFRGQITAARLTNKPLIIHTRAAGQDTLAIMREEKASDVGGVMHCFTESWSVAKACLDMGFYISFSGIVTFRKNTEELHTVLQRIPLDRLLIETDSPFLAPVPMRGKLNEPAFMIYTAACMAKLCKIKVDRLAEVTSDNFFCLFKSAHRL